MLKKILFTFCLLLTTAASNAQTVPDLGDSILIYKYSNSNDYQLILSADTVKTFYYSDSTLKAIGNYIKNKRNGNWTAFYPDGTVKTAGYITDSSYFGKWQFYHENGIRKAKGKFKYTVDDNDPTLLVLKMSGKWRFWNDSGKLMSKTYYSPFRTEKESKYGKFKERYESGKVKTTGEYHKGSKIGTWHHYHENGKKNYTAYYRYKSDIDYPVGTWVYFDEKGFLIKREVYKDGILVETVYNN